MKHDKNNLINPDKGIFSIQWLLGRPGQGPEGLQMAETFGRNGRSMKVSWLQGGKVFRGNCPVENPWALRWADLHLERVEMSHQGIEREPLQAGSLTHTPVFHPQQVATPWSHYPCLGKYRLICSIFSWH